MRGIFLKLSGQAILVVLGVALLAAWPCWHLQQETGLKTLAMAALLNLAVSIASVLIVLLVASQNLLVIHANLIAMMFRMVATGLGAFAILKIMNPPLNSFLLLVMTYYVVLLLWETLTAIKIVQANVE